MSHIHDSKWGKLSKLKWSKDGLVKRMPRPKVFDGSGLSKRIRSVGLIQLHQTLDLVVENEAEVNQD
jgi:hypothetical protein